MKCRYAGEPLRIRALSIKEVLEPGELVLYEARFHKTYQIVHALLVLLALTVTCTLAVYLLPKGIGMGYREQYGVSWREMPLLMMSWLLVLPAIAAAYCMFYSLFDFEASIKSNYCVVTSKRVIFKKYDYEHESFRCIPYAIGRITFYSFLLEDLQDIVIDQNKIEHSLKIGTCLLRGKVHIKEYARVLFVYTVTRCEKNAEYVEISCKYVCSPFALKAFIESRIFCRNGRTAACAGGTSSWR